MPDYPPFSKRFIRDDGAWARDAHARRRRRSSPTPSPRSRPTACAPTDGTLHEADVLIYGTGFTASDFLMPMRVVGRDGVELHDRWKGDARAHLGVTLPGLPEPVPALRPQHQHRRERQHHLLLRVRGAPRGRAACEALLREGAKALEPTAAVHDAYNERVDAENLRMAWGVSTVNSWYRNATGRTAQNWPFSLLEYWQRTRRPDLDDFTVHR